MRLSDDRESRNGQDPDHVCPPEVSKSFVSEVVCSLFPYFNLTENVCCFNFSNGTLMPLNINFTLPGSSVSDFPSGVDVNLGRELNFEKASQI